MDGSLCNLLYTNANPVKKNICPMCKPWIGMVFAPGTELPLPAHPGCYCSYYPTAQPPTAWNWSAIDLITVLRWIKYVAWLLRSGRAIAKVLEKLVKRAKKWNDEHHPGWEEIELPVPPEPPESNAAQPLISASGRMLLRPVSGTLDTSQGHTPDRTEYECVFMQPGRVKQADQKDSNWLIPASTIIAAEHLFSGIACYLDHPEQFGFGWRDEPKVKNLVGVTFDAHWDAAENAMVGGLRLYDQEPGSPGAFVATLMDQMLADKEAGLEVPQVGLSAVVFEDSTFDEEQGIRISTSFRYIESVDIVYDPGAGGYIRRALAAIEPGQHQWSGTTGIGGTEMPKETALQEQEAPQEPQGLEAALASIERIAAHIESQDTEPPAGDNGAPSPTPLAADDNPPPTDVSIRLDTLTDAVTHLATFLAESESRQTVTGMGQAPRSSPITMGRNSLEQVDAAFEAMMLGVSPPAGVAPLHGIRELYHLMSGDYEMTGVFNPDQVYLANVTCSTMAQLVANVLNKRVMVMFQEYPQWWKDICSIEDFATLQDVRWITLGGVGELPTVGEGAAYTELTWDDRYETDAFVKKGGYLGITIEAIDKDDTAKLRAAPRALAQAAWMTLGKSVSAIFTDATGTGPTMTDAVVLFHTATHGNLLTTALSMSAWRAVKIAMQKQTELNSSERLGALTTPKFLLVPIDLEDTALQLLATEHDPGSGDYNANVDATGNERETRLANARQRVITVPFWTDVDNWAAVADPLLYPSIGLGFRYGRVPEIFSVASPTAGLMFSNDTMPIKVRFFYAVGPIDWRGLHKNNVG